MEYVIYDPKTGYIAGTRTCSPDEISLNTPPGLSFMEGVANGPSKVNLATGQIEPGQVDIRTLDEKRLEKWCEIKKARDRVEFGPFEAKGLVFNGDEISQSRIRGQAQTAAMCLQTSTPFQTTWTLLDNSVVVLNANEMIEVLLSLTSHVEAAHARARLLREEISSSTEEHLLSISW